MTLYKIYEIKILKKTFMDFRRNIKRVFIPITIDFVGFFFFLFIWSFFFNKIVEYLSLILLKLSEDSNSFFSILLFQNDLGLLLEKYPEVGVAFKNLLILGVILFIVMYIIYVIVTGYSIFYCNWFVNRKKDNLGLFLKKYFKINLFWFFLIVVLWFVSLVLSLNTIVMQKIDTNYTGFIPASVVSVLIVFVIYMAWVSYGFIAKYDAFESFKRVFKLGLVKHAKLMVVFLVFFGFALLVDYIMGFFSSMLLVLFLGLVLLFPVFVFFRMYIISYLKSL